MKRDKIIEVLTDYYRKGEMLGYSNTELSRIRSCINKVESIADELQTKEVSNEEIRTKALEIVRFERLSLQTFTQEMAVNFILIFAKWYRDKLNNKK